MINVPDENLPYLSNDFENSDELENKSTTENDTNETGEEANFDFSPFFYANHAFQDDEQDDNDGDLTYRKLDHEKKAVDDIDKENSYYDRDGDNSFDI